MRHLLNRMLCCDWLVFSSCDWCISILAVLLCCSFGSPLSYGSTVVFLDRGHPCFHNFYSTIPVDVVTVKSYVNHLFDHVCVQYCAKRMQTNFALFATFQRKITKFRAKRNFIRIFEKPIVSMKTKIRNGCANIQAKFRRDIAKY